MYDKLRHHQRRNFDTIRNIHVHFLPALSKLADRSYRYNRKKTIRKSAKVGVGPTVAGQWARLGLAGAGVTGPGGGEGGGGSGGKATISTN